MAALTQNDLKGYIIGNNQFNFQDARVDDLENVSNIISRTQGQQGIEVRNNRLALTNGGYYDDGAALEDTSGSTATNTEPGGKVFNVKFAVQENVGLLQDGENTHFYMLYSWEDANSNTGEEELDITGSFVEDGNNPGTYYFYKDGENSEYSDDYINYIMLAEDSDWKITITFKEALAEVQIDEIGVYTIQSEPVAWNSDLVYSQDLMDTIVAYLIDNNYISDPNAM